MVVTRSSDVFDNNGAARANIFGVFTICGARRIAGRIYFPALRLGLFRVNARVKIIFYGNVYPPRRCAPPRILYPPTSTVTTNEFYIAALYNLAHVKSSISGTYFIAYQTSPSFVIVKRLLSTVLSCVWDDLSLRKNVSGTQMSSQT